jgi:hypothetical protein
MFLARRKEMSQVKCSEVGEETVAIERRAL